MTKTPIHVIVMASVTQKHLCLPDTAATSTGVRLKTTVILVCKTKNTWCVFNRIDQPKITNWNKYHHLFIVSNLSFFFLWNIECILKVSEKFWWPLTSIVWTKNYFIISFVFHRRKKVILDWIDMSMSKWWQIFIYIYIFWLPTKKWLPTPLNRNRSL